MSSTAALSPEELRLLAGAVKNPDAQVRVTVNACAYSCCGRGWLRRDGYEQTYVGYVDNLRLAEREGETGSFMLYSLGLGTISYVCAIRMSEVELVEPAAPGR